MREVRLIGPRGLVLRAFMPEIRRERMRGFLDRSTIDDNQGLLLKRTRSIHTFGMRLPISVAMLDRDFVVRDVRPLRPCRFLLPRPGVRHILECAEGADLQPGDRLRIVQAD